MKSSLRIIVAGMTASDPWQGGATWAVLQYVLGLRELGHEVLLIEPISSKALRPPGTTLGSSDNAAYFAQVARQFGLNDNSALLFNGANETFGLSHKELRKQTRSADILLNISGMLTDQDLAGEVPVRVYLDLDPAFNQLWSAVHGIDMRFGGHTHYVTIGQNLGNPDCPIPTCGFRWLKTFQPVLLNRWRPVGPIVHNGLTTIANWRGYGSIEHEGRHYGQKAHSMRQFLNLPSLTDERFLPALNIHPAESKDLDALRANGWQLLDPAQLASTPDRYQQFIQGSKAEFGIGKSGYVVSRCGWFSDRSACYLASGRPVIAQETGFSRFLPTGAGLFAFQTVEDVLTAIDKLNSDYQHQARLAREVADEYFDSRKVLNRLLEQINP